MDTQTRTLDQEIDQTNREMWAQLNAELYAELTGEADALYE
jgi:hypothetical protein